MAGALLAGVPNMANADTGDLEIEQMRAEMQALRKELAEVKALQSGGMSEAERLKFLDAQIEMVKADAMALAEESAAPMAGINEKGKMFLESADGDFTANFSGQIQFRYIWNNNDGRADEALSGFQARRVKFGVKGKVAGGWGYKLVFATSRNTGPGGGNTFTEDAYVTYKFDDNWSILVGTGKLPFARQEIVSSSRQVSVDRGLATEFFTLGRSDQATVVYKTDDIMAHLALSDGGNQDFTGFAGDNSNDFAVTARAEWQAMGDNWKEAKNEFGGVDEDFLFLAGALHYEVADRNVTGGPAQSGLAWTAEALYKTGPLGLSAAVFGNHTDNGAAADTDQLGLYVQGSYDLGNGWDAFARWDMIDDDDNAGAGTDPIQAITFGANRHYSKQVKLTGDVVYIFAGDNPSADGNFINGGELSSGLGLSSTGFSDADDQIAFRLQLQLLF